MALKKKIGLHKSAYMQLRSSDIMATGDENKNRVYIRYNVYSSESARKQGDAPIKKVEERITLQGLIDSAHDEAIKNITPDCRVVSDDYEADCAAALEVKKKNVEKPDIDNSEIELSQSEKSRIMDNVLSRNVSKEKVRIGSELWNAVTEKADSIKSIEYEITKLLPGYDTAQDA